MFPYPIDPWPGEPLPDSFDLLIYCKNGYPQSLVERLQERYPRHRVICYGHYQREELFDVARRSRACAYLADDDHGPLALQEILIAGCPAVGVRTGAAFVTPERTGYLVDKLPRNRPPPAVPSECYARFESALQSAMGLERNSVRAHAIEEFAPLRIMDSILQVLTSVRRRFSTHST